MIEKGKTALTQKQRRTLEQIGSAAKPEPHIVGWSVAYRGPVVEFGTGARSVVTRDGGIEIVV